MGTHYHQLTQEQRYQIWALHNSEQTLSEIGSTLGCHKSTVSRELRRNRHQGCYKPKQAHTLSVQRKRQAWKSSKQCAETDRLIAALIQRGWSPAALSVRMKIETSYSGRSLSHTTIYQRIAADKRRGGKLYRYLPRFGKKRWKGKGVNVINRQVQSSFLIGWTLASVLRWWTSETGWATGKVTWFMDNLHI